MPARSAAESVAERNVWRIRGGVPLCGEVRAAGAKNAALPIAAAALLADGPVRLAGIPSVADVAALSADLRSLGCDVHACDGELRIQTIDESTVCAEPNMMRRTRASFCVLGPLLARRGRAVTPLPGGCRIGPRPVDLHLRGLESLGAELRIVRGCVVANARRLRGAKIDMSGPMGPTVTGTANVLCAATLARGRTLLHGAAQEPEIIDLGRFLLSLGARIDGLGTSTIEVQGVEGLVQRRGATYCVMPDRIETATWLIAAAITGGQLTVTGAAPDQLAAIVAHLQSAGADVACGPDWIRITARRPLCGVDYTAGPYPGLPTDVQPLWAALMTQAVGTAEIQDRVFPSRFGYLDELAKLGAHYVLDRHGVAILGCQELQGASVTARDLRGGAALLLAALAAEGETILYGTRHLARGYCEWPQRLAALGGQISAEVQAAVCSSQVPSALGTPCDSVSGVKIGNSRRLGRSPNSNVAAAIDTRKAAGCRAD